MGKNRPANLKAYGSNLSCSKNYETNFSCTNFHSFICLSTVGLSHKRTVRCMLVFTGEKVALTHLFSIEEIMVRIRAATKSCNLIFAVSYGHAIIHRVKHCVHANVLKHPNMTSFRGIVVRTSARLAGDPGSNNLQKLL